MSALIVPKMERNSKLTLKNLRGGGQNDQPQVFFGITQERKRFFNEILATPRL